MVGQHSTPVDTRGLVENYVNKITLFVREADFGFRWDCSALMAGASGLDQQHLDTVIRDKAENAASYRANVKADELWLLIYCVGGDTASSPPQSDELDSFRHRHSESLAQSGFDQMWFYPAIHESQSQPDGLDRLPFCLFRAAGRKAF